MSTYWMVFIVLFVLVRTSRWRSGGRGVYRGRNYIYRWGSGTGDESRMDELMSTVEQRNQDVELLQGRVTELENRLDFAERLLAERRNAEIASG